MEGWRNCEPSSCVESPNEHPDCAGPSGLHNEVHLWVAGEREFTTEEGMDPVGSVYGTMAHDSSPNDPVFFLHHANVDRLWVQWQDRHGRNYEPVSGAPSGHNLNDAMWPFFEIGWPATPQMMLSHHILGYAYDTEDAAQ
jgi:tyrosinase